MSSQRTYDINTKLKELGVNVNPQYPCCKRIYDLEKLRYDIINENIDLISYADYSYSVDLLNELIKEVEETCKHLES